MMNTTGVFTCPQAQGSAVEQFASWLSQTRWLSQFKRINLFCGQFVHSAVGLL